MTCTEHPATADAVRHSCHVDGSSVTLWPEITRTTSKNPQTRQTVALVDADGTRTAYNDHPAAARGIYDQLERRLLDQQT